MSYEESIKKTATVLTMIVANLAFGVVGLAVIGAYVGPLMQDAGESATFLRWGALALPFMELPVAYLIYARQGVRIADMEEWETRLAMFRSRTIVTMALVEAPALFAGVVILLTGFSWHTIPPIVIFLVAAGVLFPTPARIRQVVGTEGGSAPDKYS